MTDGCAIVTGASRGIGRAIALRLANEGYDVAFCHQTSSTAADEVAQNIEATGRRTYRAICDVGDFDAAQRFVAEAQDALGPVEALVNCAGVTRDRPVATMTSDEWQEVIRTNLTGTFNFSRSVVFGLLKQRRGSIVSISSVAGLSGNAGQANYAASKAGINGFSKSLAKEVASAGVRVNVVAPGFIETDMTASLPDRA